MISIANAAEDVSRQAGVDPGFLILAFALWAAGIGIIMLICKFLLYPSEMKKQNNPPEAWRKTKKVRLVAAAIWSLFVAGFLVYYYL